MGITRVDAEGCERDRDVFAGDAMADTAVFSPVYSRNAVGMTTAVACFHRKARLLAEFRRNPRAALHRVCENYFPAAAVFFKTASTALPCRTALLPGI
jgi:hypothetical protein